MTDYSKHSTINLGQSDEVNTRIKRMEERIVACEELAEEMVRRRSALFAELLTLKGQLELARRLHENNLSLTRKDGQDGD